MQKKAGRGPLCLPYGKFQLSNENLGVGDGLVGAGNHLVFHLEQVTLDFLLIDEAVFVLHADDKADHIAVLEVFELAAP